MYEVVKVVNGHAIERMVGTHGCYHVLISKGESWAKYRYFNTIKAAAEFCSQL